MHLLFFIILLFFTLLFFVKNWMIFQREHNLSKKIINGKLKVVNKKKIIYESNIIKNLN